MVAAKIALSENHSIATNLTRSNDALGNLAGTISVEMARDTEKSSTVCDVAKPSAYDLLLIQCVCKANREARTIINKTGGKRPSGRGNSAIRVKT
jgi:hypothetical protein